MSVKNYKVLLVDRNFIADFIETHHSNWNVLIDK